jgi:hypothetical protein
MQFTDSDLHDAMKIGLEALIDIIKTSQDPIIKGNACISLARILMDIFDRQHALEEAQTFLDMEDSDEEEGF